MKDISFMELDNEGSNSVEFIDKMYEYVKNYAQENNFLQTLRALSFSKSMHHGQYRKGKGNIPYIYHPLVISCQAIALGLGEDDIIATCLLHDVCEDCGVKKNELPVDEHIKEAVELLTKDMSLYAKDIDAERRYYNLISRNKISCIVKLLDRCNNISDMSSAFSKEKMMDYIDSTEYFIYPLFDVIDNEYSEYSIKMFAVRYHMSSVIKTIKNIV